MKKNVKKVENKGIDSTELIMALNELEKEQGIKKDFVLESIETALVTAYKKNFDVVEDNVKITMNPETGETFEGFFDRYTFNAAIREFEEKRQEIADYLSPGAKEDIFSYIRPLKTNQIFTPRKVVNKMLDLLEENNPGIFEDPNATFADLYVKN